jgi:hypothetical protein
MWGGCLGLLTLAFRYSPFGAAALCGAIVMAWIYDEYLQRNGPKREMKLSQLETERIQALEKVREKRSQWLLERTSRLVYGPTNSDWATPDLSPAGKEFTSIDAQGVIEELRFRLCCTAWQVSRPVLFVHDPQRFKRVDAYLGNLVEYPHLLALVVWDSASQQGTLTWYTHNETYQGGDEYLVSELQAQLPSVAPPVAHFATA